MTIAFILAFALPQLCARQSTGTGIQKRKRAPGHSSVSTATRSNADIVGSWPVVLYVPGNELRFQLQFERQDGRLAGTLNTELGSLPIHEISVKGNTLSFAVTLFGNTYRFRGEVSGNELSGQWLASGPWKGSRRSGKEQ